MGKNYTNKDKFFDYLDKAINPYSQSSSIKKKKQKRVGDYSEKQTHQHKVEDTLAKQRDKSQRENA